MTEKREYIKLYYPRDEKRKEEFLNKVRKLTDEFYHYIQIERGTDSPWD